ncbi:MAG: polysaccharide pyruvyl transferase family protein [Heliobacteriaceae bacterium]|jgi:hypothetical protein|nr:polysaccharide pyruvyl transferase family protein [Heliobacteriaceae bacterium]
MHKVIKFCGFKIKIRLNEDDLMPLRVANRELEVKLLKERENFSRLMNSDPRKPKCYLLNVNIGKRFHEHEGGTSVRENIEYLLDKNGLELVWTDVNNPVEEIDEDFFRLIMSKCDLLLINGEGILHHNRGVNHLQKCRIAKELGKKVVLINAVWQENSETKEYLKYFDLISARESYSANEMKKDGALEPLVVPDMTFYNHKIEEGRSSCKNQLIFTDSVDIEVSAHLCKLAKNNNSPYFFMTTESGNFTSNIKGKQSLLKYSDISETKYIITGRYHAACFAIMNKIPVLCVESNTYKVNGLMADAELEEHLVLKADAKSLTQDRVRDFMLQNHSEFCNKAEEYSKNAVLKIENLFEKIKEIAL